MRSRANGRGPRLRHGKTWLAGGVVASMVMMPMSGAFAAPSDDSEALGQVISTELFDLNLLKTAFSRAGNPSGPGANREPIDLSVLGEAAGLGLNVDGIALPLLKSVDNPNGLLDLGALGVLNSYAKAGSGTSANAAAGTVGQDGAIAVDGDAGGKSGNAKINLTSLLGQLGVTGLAPDVINAVELEAGAIASEAGKTGPAITSDYLVADVKANIASPLVGKTTTDLGGVVTALGTTLNTALASDGPLLGAVSSVVDVIDLDLTLVKIKLGPTTVGVSGVDAAMQGVKNNLITKNASDPKGIASINLGKGTVSIDVAKAFDSVKGLNEQGPNTEVINAATLTAITTAIGAAVDDLTLTLTTEIKNAINSIGLTVKTTAAARVGGPVADGDVTIHGTLGEFLGTAATKPVVDPKLSILGIISADALLSGLTGALLPALKTGVGSVVNPVLNGVGSSVSGKVTPLVDVLAPVIDGVLAQIVQVTVNDQPTMDSPVRPALLGAGSFTVSALTLTLLPKALAGSGAAKVSLGTSSIRALDAALPAVATIVATPGSVEAGTSTTVTGENWTPAQVVTVQLVDGSAANVGAPVTMTPGVDGKLNVVLPVAVGTVAANYTVKGSNTTQTAVTALVVTAAITDTSPSGKGADKAADKKAANSTLARTGTGATNLVLGGAALLMFIGMVTLAATRKRKNS